MAREIEIKADSVILHGILAVPADASGIVVFAHGSGSGRFSPRNAFVAGELQKAGTGTLLIDLLTEREDDVYETRFDIDLLTVRLGRIITRLGGERETAGLPVALFGASTGAAAALNAAAEYGERIAAVVSRGGRPDLALRNLGKVRAPTLLIVGGDDTDVIDLNRQAFAALACVKKLEIIPGATHLFEEPGALEEVARLAVEWFRHYFISK